jgi:hypothetical protein
MKKLILVLALLCCSPALAQECGDVNENGEVTAADALGVLQSAVGLGALSCRTGDFVALEDRVAVIEEGPRILGFSGSWTTGRIIWNGLVGLPAAADLCQASYPLEPKAHMCSDVELVTAHTAGNYDINIEDSPGRVLSLSHDDSQQILGFEDIWNCQAYTCDDYAEYPEDAIGGGCTETGNSPGLGMLAKITSLTGPSDGLDYSWVGWERGLVCDTLYPVFCCR